MASLSRRLIAEAIAEKLLSGESTQKTMHLLAAYLIDNHLISQADYFVSDIERILAQNQTVVANVITARPLDADLRSAITTALSADRVELRESVEADMIGGVIIKTPTQELDASVRTALRRLRTT